jgi:endonuclease/exonuclease/phosphatase (EEP) superfamily protein YafD
VIALHPMPPVSLQWQHTRNRTFAVLRPSGNAPALAIGDYNATPWSNAAPILVQGGWRWFGGVQPTWRNSAWGIPIDAVWGHGPWQVVGHEVGPPIGSDHRPLRVDLRLAAAAL